MISVLTAGIVGLLVSIFGTPVAIRILIKRGFGQPIHDALSASHHTKRGTPTTGGSVIIIAVVAGYFIAHLVRLSAPTASGLLVLFLVVGLGIVGFMDDFIKVRSQRNLGLRARAKMLGQIGVAVAFGIMALKFPNEQGYTPGSEAVSFLRDTGLVLPSAVFVIWAVIIISGSSNAVNITDGLDGLATGASAMVFGAYTLIGVWQINQSCSTEPGPTCYEVRDPLDLAVVSAALVGACFGFLWWNAKPAKIIMGDTGSLSLGGALAGLAIVSRTQLLLVVLGGLFAIVTLSSVLQVGWFKFTRLRGEPKRLFRIAPIQHHFEQIWDEVTVVVRFWIISGMFVVLGIGIFYTEWVAGT